MLVQAHRQAAANQAELRLVVLATAVLRALKLVRMDFLLPIYPSLDAALTPDAQPERELPAPSRPAHGCPGSRPRRRPTRPATPPRRSGRPPPAPDHGTPPAGRLAGRAVPGNCPLRRTPPGGTGADCPHGCRWATAVAGAPARGRAPGGAVERPLRRDGHLLPGHRGAAGTGNLPRQLRPGRDDPWPARRPGSPGDRAAARRAAPGARA